ncbi:ABC transporter ATP-binding protein [Pseudonocardia sp. Cha107L01]|uniref:ABC transporter ATP-binding protein n=1 Tax=Pseudonocardia sp. Cha107L01 TaxID=3457576 RepID=UPI00403E631F
MNATTALLSLRGVSRTFTTRRALLGRRLDVVHAVNDVSLDIAAGETLGIVGESGSGKSTLGRVALRLIEPDRGTIEFDGRDLLGADGRDLRRERQRMTVIFQDPYTSLDPRWTVERLVGEPLRIAGGTSPADQRDRVVEALRRVGLEPDVLTRRPRGFSGGQRQRIVIARALVTRPKLVFCDEPVSALDVSTRARVLGLLRELQVETGLAYLFVSHDLGVVEAVSDRIAVMYLGSIVEVGGAETVAQRYGHPYTAALVSASPAPDPLDRGAKRRIVLRGDPPSPITPPSGCAFHPRCPLAQPVCAVRKPPLRADPDGHAVACHRTAEDRRLRGADLLDLLRGEPTMNLLTPEGTPT